MEGGRGGFWVFRESVSQPSEMMSKTSCVCLPAPSPQSDSIEFLAKLDDLQQSFREGLPFTFRSIPPTHISVRENTALQQGLDGYWLAGEGRGGNFSEYALGKGFQIFQKIKILKK